MSRRESPGTGRGPVRAALASLTVGTDATLREALAVIETGHQEIAFVCDRKGRVLGTLTDGDIRRAILAGASLESPGLGEAMHRDFSWVPPEAGRDQVLDIMRARRIAQIPVLDQRGRLRGVHLLQELIGAAQRPNWAVIMAGGRGSRLRPLTDRIPKPMLPVAGRPILERLVLHLTGHGIRRIFLSVNHLAEVIERHFGDGSRHGCRIEYLHDPGPVGTGGALGLLPQRPREPLLVLNGDLITQVDVGQLLDFHVRGRFTVSVGLRPHRVEIPFGVVRLRGRRVVELREKPTEHMLVNAGIYVVSPSALRLVPRGREFPMTELIRRCQERERGVGGYVIEDEWLDVGRHEELRKARGEE